MQQLEKYEVPSNLAALGYRFFCSQLEGDSNIAFRAIRISEMSQTLKEGLKPRELEGGISFAKHSKDTLVYIDEYIRQTGEDVCLLIVRFVDAADARIVQDGPYLHIYRTDIPGREEILPEIIGYCIVPRNYR